MEGNFSLNDKDKNNELMQTLGTLFDKFVEENNQLQSFKSIIHSKITKSNL